ncbi:glycosyltransferase family 1 protein [uncultured Bacteroides sp.]|uniref:glycosyltransferase family 4 protein n=1 Tax=uncultured Bacteroides sp. TaxID=162156 RepID=UPI002AAB7ABA|nr:glycosyltransferase family 1 protein [uncultured Bacteroides sp.]
MKIAIEAQRIFRKKKHGMDFVALESIRELQKIDTKNEYFIFVSPGPDRCLSESKNVHIIELKCPSYPLWEQIALPYAIHKLKPDLLHCTSNTAPLVCSVPLILTLHDIIFLEQRQSSNLSWYQEMGWYYRRIIVPHILYKCKKIITVSKFECNRIHTTLQLPQEVLTVVYNGYSPSFSPNKKDRSITLKYIQSEGYLFFLGNTDPKKNTVGVLKAYYVYLQQSTQKRSLLIADLKEEIIDSILIKEGIEKIKSHLIFPGYIPNKDLIALYNGAFAFLYPSLRESFGIPMLEAMACGIPIITSNTSAMPEIAGEDSLLVNPFNIQEIADCLLQLEQDKELYKKQVDYGLIRTKLFSWESTANKLLKIYKDILPCK